MSGPDTGAVLTAIARLVADAPTLEEVVSKAAVVLRPAIPFERLHVLRLDRTESVVLYTALASGTLEVVGHRLTDARSAGLHPDSPLAAGGPLGAGTRSVMMSPLRDGPRVAGALWCTSSLDGQFATGHHALLDAVADLLGLAVQHDSLRATEAIRRERLDSLERLLQTMAGALDVRAVFSEVSDVIRAALPHDVLVLTSWAEDGASYRVHAVAGASISDSTFWEPVGLARIDQPLMDAEPYVINDVARDVDPTSVRGTLFARVGAGSVLRVAVPLHHEVFGSLFFVAREPDRFDGSDVDFARRVANGLALALSHQRLSDAARRDAESRETAARLEAQVATLKREIETRSGHRRITGTSAPWKDVLTQAARVAPTETTVLLTGESGTGKEVIARFIHHASPRASGTFVAINCAALPDQLLESELFGHERGAFTGAVAAKPGRIEQANGGVLFLDEIGEMSTAVQAKLLRVLEEREFLRLGGTRLLRADIRVIAATNRDLASAMQRGDFREDLYYRLSVFEIALPPLRERPSDVLELAGEFLDEIGVAVGRPAAGLAPDARDQLVRYAWPGNVRELRNAIERAVILADGGLIRAEHLPFGARNATGGNTTVPERLPSAGIDIQDIERSLVAKALTQARFNKTRAARLLGLTRSQLYSRIAKYGLEEVPDTT